MTSAENLYPAARALAAVRYGGKVPLDRLSIEEEAGWLLIAATVRGIVRGR